jgi:hypothetical protein
MAIKKDSSRQEQVVASPVINATDLISTVIGTSTATTNKAVQLPAGAIITGGSLTTVVPFNTVGVLAHGTLTATTSYTPSAGETVTIGSQVYTWRAALTAPTTAYEVLIDGTINSYANLTAAINADQTVGVVGVAYGSLTPVNTKVTAVHTSSYVVNVTSKVASTANDTVSTTSTTTYAAWGATTLVDYVVPADTIAVQIGATSYLTATTVDVVNHTALVPTGVATTTETTVDLIWDAASTTTLAPTLGQVVLEVQYYVIKRAQFSEGN